MDDGAEQRWVRQARAGDRGAFNQLLEANYPTVFAIALSRLREQDAAEDLAQEVFLRAWLHLGQLREAERFGPWVGRIARNLATSWLRSGERSSRLARMVPMDAEQVNAVQDERPHAREALEAEQAKAALAEALARLPEAERELVLLHFMQNVSQRHLAEQLGVNHSTVSRRLDKALGTLRGLLGGEAPAAALPRPRAGATAAAMALVAGVTQLPATGRAALVHASQDTALLGAAPSPSLFLLAQKAPWAKGFLLMSATNKSLIAATAALLVLGGAYTYHAGAGPFAAAKPGTSATTTAAARPDVEVNYATGQEATFNVPRGKRVRVHFAAQQVVDQKFEKYIANYRFVDMLVQEDGNLRLEVTNQDGSTETSMLPPTAGAPDDAILQDIQIWQEMNRAAVQFAFVRPTAEGLEVLYYQRNRPELLPALKAVERRVEQGLISRRQGGAEATAILERGGMFPNNPELRRTMTQALQKMYAR